MAIAEGSTSGIQDPMLRELSQELSYEWQSLASFLGLKVVEISVLKMDFPGQTENQVFNMLIWWRQRQDSTVDQRAVLCEALRKVKRVDLAIRLQGPRRNSEPPRPPQGVAGQNGLGTTGHSSEGPLTSKPPSANHSLRPARPWGSSGGQQLVSASSDIGSDKLTTNTISKETQDVAENKPPQDAVPSCSQHKGEAVEFFCVPCQQLICSQCAEKDHPKPQHHCLRCETAHEKYKFVLESKIPQLDEQVNEVRDFMVESSQQRREFENKVSRTVEEVRDRAARLIEEVKAEESRLIEEIRKLEQDRHMVFHDHEKRATVLLGAKQHALETASEVAKVVPHAQFLSQYLMASDVMDMALNGQHCPKGDPRLSYLSFTASPAAEGAGVSLGRLELGGRWEMRCEFGSKGSGPGEFQLAKGIAARQPGEIEVADYINKRVVVFSTEGEVLKTIPTQGVPRNIAALHTHLAVVDDASHVQLYTRYNAAASVAGKKRCDFRSVALKSDGTVLVGDVGKCALTEHMRGDGALKRTMPLKLKPYFIGVAAQLSDRVVISNGFQREVHVMNIANEALLAVIKPEIAGRPVYQCTGVCCDNTGIFVAVSGDERSGQGHLHQYDMDGAFRACIAQGLHNPQGITLTADGHQLAVADTYSVKIFHKV